MHIAVFGLGYVGLVTSACLAEWGHDVTGFDANVDRRRALDENRMPFHEPGLAEMVAANRDLERLRFATFQRDRIVEVVGESDAVVVAVGTHDGNGGWQTTTILNCLQDVVPALPVSTVLIIRSTLPPEFVKRLPSVLSELRGHLPPITAILNPEFTREGTALNDFLRPERVVVGIVADPAGIGEACAHEMYRDTDAPILTMPAIDASFAKLGSNLFLATKISFANELARLCGMYGADIEGVVAAMAYDSRIGGSFLRAGVGFGGSCLPHQVTMTTEAAARHGVDVPLISAVDVVNHRQRETFVELIASSVTDGLAGKRVAILGLSFKPHTDDLRDAPAITITRRLLEMGAQPVAYDPMPAARDRAAQLVSGLEVVASVAESLDGADAVGLVTEWPEFSQIDWQDARSRMRGNVVVDGRNALHAAMIVGAGFRYLAFGRRIDQAGDTVKAIALREIPTSGVHV